MIVCANVLARQLAAAGRSFKGFRPSCRNNCGCSVWGHGWVRRYFDGYPEGIELQRFRCRDCRSVMTLRPQGFWPRFQASVNFIHDTLHYRLVHYFWPPGIRRQRAGHWLRQLIAKVRMDFPERDLLDCLGDMYRQGIAFLV